MLLLLRLRLDLLPICDAANVAVASVVVVAADVTAAILAAVNVVVVML